MQYNNHIIFHIIFNNFTNIIKQNGYRLLKTVNNLIISTRLYDGYPEYNPHNSNIVEGICNSVQSYVNKEKIMAFNFKMMERILLNLLSNAIKYNKINGKIEVSLNFKDDYMYISVKDSGVDIPNDKLSDVFKLFKQVNKKSEGNGIGLAIVKSLVSLHNGTITVNSIEVYGSKIFKKDIKLIVSFNY